MHKRRHHNNKGYAQIKSGKTFDQVERIKRKLKIDKGEKKCIC